MVTVRIPTIGEILLDIATLIYSNGLFHIAGHDNEHKLYVLKCSQISWQDDLSSEYGWARIVEYQTGGECVKCSLFTSIA